MEWTVAIVVDTHRDLHVAVAVDRLGRRLGSLARALLADGFLIFECERPRRRKPSGQRRPDRAELAARRLLTGERLPLLRTGLDREQLRLLLVERRSANHARQQALNQLKAAVVTLAPPLRARLEHRRPSTLAHSSVLRRQPELASLRRLAKRIVLLEQELAEVDHELNDLTLRLCPKLRAQPGVGPICAGSYSSRPPTHTGSETKAPSPPSPASAPTKPQAAHANATDSTAPATDS